MDELYGFLFAGLIIILMLVVFFGGGFKYGIAPETPGEYEEVEGVEWKIINFGDLSIRSERVQKTNVLDNEFGVHNGIFFGNSGYSRIFELDEETLANLNSARLMFAVEETNNYGDLSIKFGNETIAKENFLRGEYYFDVQPELKNTVEIKADSSGWKIWAPTTYIISNLSIQADYISRESPKESFFVSDFIYERMEKGELVFELVDADNEINVTLNGEPEYFDFPDSKNVVIGLENLVSGKNYLTFSSEGEAMLRDVKIRLFYFK